MAEVGTMVISLAGAAKALEEELGCLTDAEYVPGKTQFRDVLCARFGLSQLESEELCDQLEAAGLIRFVETEKGIGWHIHPSREEGDANLPIG